MLAWYVILVHALLRLVRFRDLVVVMMVVMVVRAAVRRRQRHRRL